MKRMLPVFGLLFLFSLITNCNNDDPASNGDDPISLDELISALTSNGDVKSWKIEFASLSNGTVNDLNVSEAFNIKDDEFLFSANGQGLQLTYRARNAFNEDATDFQSFLLDFYKSPIDYSIATNPNDPSNFSANNGMEFNLEEGMINGQWTLGANTTLSFTLTIKSSEDYLTPPASLNFQEVVTIPSEYQFEESVGSADILGSQSNNSIYMIYSTDQFPNPIPNTPSRAEGVIRYDLNTNQFNFNIFHNQDFFTKRAWISNNKLKVLGSQAINTYDDLDIPGDPDDSFYYNLCDADCEYFYVRHDIVISDDLIYLMGGSLEPDPIPGSVTNYFDKVLTYNDVTQELTNVTTLPGSKSMAAVELVDDKIYIIGGCQGFTNFETAETTSYIYDLSTNSFSTFNLPNPVAVTFGVAVENLIYIAGNEVIQTEDSLDYNIFFGVYNTETAQFSELPHNLDDSGLRKRVSGITYYNDELFILYQNSDFGDTEDYKLMSTQL